MGIKISALTEALASINTDILHLRTSGGIDKKITNSNLFGSDLLFSGDNTFSGANILSGINTFSNDNVFNGDNTFNGDDEFTGDPLFSGNSTFNNMILSQKGLKVSGFLNGASLTENQIFDAMASFLPTTNDEILISGGGTKVNGTVGASTYWSSHYVFSKALKLNATTISLFYEITIITFDASKVLVGLGSNFGSINMENGNANVNFDDISIAW